jgi:hypothetical protein
MHDHATRLVGLDGLVVTEVQRVGEQFDLQVELLARAACCRKQQASPRAPDSRTVGTTRGSAMCHAVVRALHRRGLGRASGRDRTEAEILHLRNRVSRVAGGIAAPGSLESRRDGLPSPGSSDRS